MEDKSLSCTGQLWLVICPAASHSQLLYGNSPWKLWMMSLEVIISSSVCNPLVRNAEDKLCTSFMLSGPDYYRAWGEQVCQ